MTMRLGIFGGTFDPPHLGHMILAAEAADQLQLDKVLWLLAPNPPHKIGNRITSYAERMDMVRACIAAEPKFELSAIENERPGPHYTADTLAILRSIYPDSRFVLLVGGDSLQHLREWHAPEVVIERTDELGVMSRPGDAYDWDLLNRLFPSLREKIRMIDAPLLEISSTEIRERAAENKHFRYYLEPDVFALIRERGFYRGKSE